MSWDIIGKPISTAEMGTTAISQRIITPPKRILLKAVQAHVIFYGDPVFTALSMRLYHDSAGSPGALIAETFSKSKAELITLDHGCKFIGWEFDKAIPMQLSTAYHFVLFASGYTGDDTSHIAWKYAYPDPQFEGGLTLDAAHADNHPLELTMVGADL